jgi:hypothetical protein
VRPERASARAAAGGAARAARRAAAAARARAAFVPRSFFSAARCPAGYEVNDIRDSSVWYYFNVCGATATPQTDDYTRNREELVLTRPFRVALSRPHALSPPLHFLRLAASPQAA